VLVGAASGRPGARVISVVLGEPSEAAREADTLTLLRHGLAQFRRVRALDRQKTLASAAVAHFDSTVALRAEKDLFLVARRGQRVTSRIDSPDELEGELEAGAEVGEIAVVRAGRTVKRVPLVTAARVPGAGFLRKAADGAALPLVALLVLVVGFAVLAARTWRSRVT